MNRKIMVAAVLLVFGLAATTAASAGTVTITTSSTGWVKIADNVFALPADLTGIGCGFENETTCEPAGVFHFNVALSGSGAAVIFDNPDNTGLSDVLTWGNDPASGLGVLTFKSDPDQGSLPTGDFITLCSGNGEPCTGEFTLTDVAGDVITLNPASDGEAPFDPFGLGKDTSDQLKVTGATISVTTPEPGSMLLFGTGLVGLAGAIRRKLRK